jgi:hypothetical protein
MPRVGLCNTVSAFGGLGGLGRFCQEELTCARVESLATSQIMDFFFFFFLHVHTEEQIMNFNYKIKTNKENFFFLNENFFILNP